jgi:hypothetical protein
MADSTSDQVEDNEPRAKKPRHQPSGCTMSGNKQDVVKYGYGNVVPIGVKNIYNKGGQIVPYIFKWQKYLDLDFSNNQHPIVIPYLLDGDVGQANTKHTISTTSTTSHPAQYSSAATLGWRSMR